MRLLRHSLSALILMGLATACQSTHSSPAPMSPAPMSPASSSAPASPASSAGPGAPSASVEIVDSGVLGPILGAWRAEPLRIPSGVVPRVDQACRANFGLEFPAGDVLTLIDARGEGRVPAYYASAAGAWASCTDLVVDARGEVTGERGHAVSPGSLDDLGPLEIEFVDFTWSPQRPAPIEVSNLVGTAGVGVARVEVRSPGRASIVASLANGWWAAWIPGPMPTQWRIVALDALGRDVDTADGASQNQDP